jgi:hypothetical protein
MAAMSKAGGVRCGLYGVVAVVALIATWKQNLMYFGKGDFVAANWRFWSDTIANPAARSITVDIMMLVVALALFMVHEARRLGIRFVWLYLVGGALIAISVTAPLFFIARERRLSLSESTPLTPIDLIALPLFCAGPLLLSLYTLIH